jgi:hypothetical protein
LTDLGTFALTDITIADELADARGSIVVAFLDELEREPQLLAAYAEVVGPDDDITLAVDATDIEEGAALRRIQGIIARSGVAVDRMPDALLVAKPTVDMSNIDDPDRGARVAKAIKIDVERRADALLTRRPARLGTQAYSPDRLDELQAGLATRPRRDAARG